jgi:hypothetical protein
VILWPRARDSRGAAMWTAENRGTYDHKTKRYPSDLTDEEWALVEPHLPPPTKGRRHQALDRREPAQREARMAGDTARLE